MGAKMVVLYPISTLPPSISLNITVYSYNNTLFIGLIGSRSAIPDLNLLEGYIHAAFEDVIASVESVQKGSA